MDFCTYQKSMSLLKIVITAVFFSVSSFFLHAQSSLEREFIEAGFENVKHIVNSDKEILFAEGTPFKPRSSCIKEAVKIAQSYALSQGKERIDVILIENKIPVYKLEGAKSGETMKWETGFYDGKGINALSHDEKKGAYNGSAGKTDLKFYPQFRFKNYRLDKMYLVQLNLNPAIETNLWRGALLTAQVIIPVYNDYSIEEGRVRPGFVTLSQQTRLPGNIHLLATVGNFNNFRAGADLKAFYAIRDKVGIYGQLGFTGWSLAMFDKWVMKDFNQFNWKAGANYFLKPLNMLINLNIAMYMANDIAARGELIRYFKNSAVGFYVQTLGHEGYPLNGGFFFSINLPPGKQKRSSFVRVTTANHFAMEYIARPYPLRGRMYETSPDESSSNNFFNKLIINQYFK